MSSESHQTGERDSPRLSLQSLPVELLLQIISLFANPARCREDFVPLYSLSLTNRRLYHLTLPYLYRVVDNRWYNERRFPELFLRNPRLASEIKYLACFDRRKNTPRLVSVLSRRGWQALSEKAEELGLRNARRLCHMAQAYSLSDFVGVLLLLALNLECLDLSDEFALKASYWETYVDALWVAIFEDMGMKDSVLGIRHFQRLHTIRIARGSSRPDSRLEPLLLLFKLRSLRTLMIEKRFINPQEFLHGHEEDIGESSIENLFLLSCQIDSSVVADFLSLIKSLHVFVYEWPPFSMGLPDHFIGLDETDPHMNHSTLTTALLAHKNSLEHISMETASSTLPNEISGTLGDFGEMHNLHFLEVMLHDLSPRNEPWTTDAQLDAALKHQYLRLAERLPRSLRQLYLSTEAHGKDDEFWARYLEDVTRQCTERASALTEVKLFIEKRKSTGETVGPKTFPPRFSEKGVAMSMEYLTSSRHQLNKGRHYLLKELEFRSLMHDFVPAS